VFGELPARLYAVGEPTFGQPNTAQIREKISEKSLFPAVLGSGASEQAEKWLLMAVSGGRGFLSAMVLRIEYGRCDFVLPRLREV
jgi:hypothetical protein